MYHCLQTRDSVTHKTTPGISEQADTLSREAGHKPHTHTKRSPLVSQWQTSEKEMKDSVTFTTANTSK